MMYLSGVVADYIWNPNQLHIEHKLRTDYVKPINVSSDVHIEDGKTIIIYMGNATLSNGESIDINEQVILDFAASDKLPEY